MGKGGVPHTNALKIKAQTLKLVVFVTFKSRTARALLILVYGMVKLIPNLREEKGIAKTI